MSVDRTPRLSAVALGSNLGDRTRTLQSAVDQLRRLGRLAALSQIYETPPWGPPQPAYLNAVALLETNQPPLDLLTALLGIERSLGRVRSERWGPRTIDLDLITVGTLSWQDDQLVLPHPEAHRRPFVLVPLAEVWPDSLVSSLGHLPDLLAALPPSDIAAVHPVGRLTLTPRDASTDD